MNAAALLLLVIVTTVASYFAVIVMLYSPESDADEMRRGITLDWMK
jgi:hypothetical protein